MTISPIWLPIFKFFVWSMAQHSATERSYSYVNQTKLISLTLPRPGQLLHGIPLAKLSVLENDPNHKIRFEERFAGYSWEGRLPHCSERIRHRIFSGCGYVEISILELPQTWRQASIKKKNQHKEEYKLREWVDKQQAIRRDYHASTWVQN